MFDPATVTLGPSDPCGPGSVDPGLGVHRVLRRGRAGRRIVRRDLAIAREMAGSADPSEPQAKRKTVSSHV
jgi:hypothetical protein